MSVPGSPAVGFRVLLTEQRAEIDNLHTVIPFQNPARSGAEGTA